MSDKLIDRGIPCSPAAEMAVLGAILLDNAAYWGATAIIDLSDFHDDRNRRIFQALASLISIEGAADSIMLAQELGDQLSACGGVSYISSLTDGLPRSTNIEHYARIVAQKTVERRALKAAYRVANDALTGSQNGDILQNAIDMFSSLQRFEKELLTTDAWFAKNYGNLDGYLRRVRQRGMSTGIPTLDRLTRGLCPGNFILVAARTSMGKTTLACNMAQRAVDDGARVAIFSLEMDQQRITDRLLAHAAQIPFSALFSNRMSREEAAAVLQSSEIFSGRLLIDDTRAMKTQEIRAKAKLIKSQKGLDVIFIDYLQRIRPPRAENRNQEITVICRELADLAGELKIPLVVMSQLSRQTEMRPGNRPQLSDLRESGSQEQDADLVLFIHWPEYYLTRSGQGVEPDQDGRAELIVAKNRDGPTGVVPLYFDPARYTFTEAF